MKPIKLKLENFASYKKEEIDLEMLTSRPLFLITGNTGSGKSTIFDGIIYALYGRTSGGKDIETLRNTLAKDEEETKVSLEFSIGDEVFLIERSVGYQKEKNKSQTQGKLSLENLTNKEFLGSKKKEVNELIEELIGLTYEQFRKVVLLPQGQFDKLLNSNSKEKKEIMGTLFGTDIYKEFSEELKTKKKILKDERVLFEGRIISDIRHLGIESLEENFVLGQEIFDRIKEYLIGKKDDLVEQKTLTLKKKEELEKVSSELEEAKRICLEFHRLEELKERANKHKEKEAEFNVKKSDLDKTYILKEKKPYIESLLVVREHIKDLEAIKVQLHNSIEENLKEEKDIDSLVANLEKRKASYDDAREFISSNSFYYNNLTEYEKLFEDEKRLNNVPKEIEEKTRALKELDEKIRKENESYKKGQEYIVKINQEIFDLKEKAGLIKIEEEKELTIEDKNKKLVKVEEELKNLYEKKKELKEKNEELSKLLAEGEEGYLASIREELKYGEKCPLCQQKIENIEKSKIDKIDKVDFDSEHSLETKNYLLGNIKNIKKELDVFRTEETKAIENIRHIEREKEELKLEIKVLENKLSRDLLDNKSEILEELKESQIRQKKYENRFEEIEKNLKFCDENKKSIDLELKVLEQSKEKLDKIRGNLENIRPLLEKYKSLGNFQIEYDRFKGFISNYENELEEKGRRENQFKIKKAKLEERGREFRTNIRKSEEEKIRLENKILDEKFRKNYDLEDISKEDLEEVEKNISFLEEVIREYENEKIILKGELESQEKLLIGKEKPSMEGLEEEKEKSEAEFENCNKERISLEEELLRKEKEYENIIKNYEAYSIKRKEDKKIEELADAMSGKNDSKISIETFVLTYYLDQILYAANRILFEMSGKQYTLFRKQSTSGKGEQGLDILVRDLFDNREREISSLSGGETFMASLSMALGMADVIQNNNGNKALETVFIDEGFGALDADLLEEILEILRNIQSENRSMGIISHTKVLKDGIDTKLIVEKTNEGTKVKVQI